jgi:hypothetical protein
MPAQSDLNLGPSARAAKVLAGLSRTPNRVADVLEDLSHWERVWRPDPATWNCTEIAGHLFDAEIAFGYRIRSALAEPGKAIDAFDQDAWVSAQAPAAVALEENLSAFAALRRNLVLLAARLTEDELSRHYLHSKRGRQTILETIVFLQAHDERHMVQLGRVSELARQARPLA